MKKLLGIILIFIFVFNSNLNAKDLNVICETELFATNNTFSFGDLLKKDYSDLLADLNKDIYFNSNREARIILEFAGGDYFIGYIREYEDSVRTNDETALFYIEEHEGMTHSRKEYKAKLANLSQSLEGIVLGAKVFENKDKGIYLSLSGKLLKGKELSWRNYDGKVYKTEDTNKYYCSGIKRRISSDMNDTIELSQFSSNGYSLGTQLLWEIKPNLKLSYQGKNIYSKIKWNNVYTENQPLKAIDLDPTLNYSVKSISTQGFFPYPDGTSHWGQEDYITRLVAKHDIKLETTSTELGVFYRDLDYGRRCYPYFNYKLLYKELLIKPGVFGPFFALEVAYKGFNLQLKTEDLDFFNSSGLYGQLRFNYQF